MAAQSSTPWGKGGVSNVWGQSLDGGPPARLTSFSDGDISNFDIARDGRLALSRGSATSSVVMIGGWQ